MLTDPNFWAGILVGLVLAIAGVAIIANLGPSHTHDWTTWELKSFQMTHPKWQGAQAMHNVRSCKTCGFTETHLL